MESQIKTIEDQKKKQVEQILTIIDIIPVDRLKEEAKNEIEKSKETEKIVKRDNSKNK